MKYESVKTPIELLKFMSSHITYGFTSPDGEVYTPLDDERYEYGVLNLWKLSSPERLVEVKHGHCFDQVELERDWFISHGYKCRTFFIWFELEYENPFVMHTYLVYEDCGKFYLFEHSDGLNRGILEFETIDEAIRHQMKNHLKFNNGIRELTRNEIESLNIYEYTKPEYDIGMDEYIDYILENGVKVL